MEERNMKRNPYINKRNIITMTFVIEIRDRVKLN